MMIVIRSFYCCHIHCFLMSTSRAHVSMSILPIANEFVNWIISASTNFGAVISCTKKYAFQYNKYMSWVHVKKLYLQLDMVWYFLQNLVRILSEIWICYLDTFFQDNRVAPCLLPYEQWVLLHIHVRMFLLLNSWIFFFEKLDWINFNGNLAFKSAL